MSRRKHPTQVSRRSSREHTAHDDVRDLPTPITPKACGSSRIPSGASRHGRREASSSHVRDRLRRVAPSRGSGARQHRILWQNEPDLGATGSLVQRGLKCLVVDRLCREPGGSRSPSTTKTPVMAPRRPLWPAPPLPKRLGSGAAEPQVGSRGLIAAPMRDASAAGRRIDRGAAIRSESPDLD